MSMPTLIPAYGRDYKSKAAVLRDYQAGKDFRLADAFHGRSGAYCSIRDFPDTPVKIRYAKLRRVLITDPDKNSPR